MQKLITAFGIGLLIGIMFSLLTAFPIMLIWNAIIPNLLGLKQIDFWQALGLAALARLIWGTGSSPSSDK